MEFMKKRWRLGLLGVAPVIAATVAASAWLGYLPVGGPDNEVDFMTQQLRRIRFAGPLRTDAEKGIAEHLPEDPTTDDLRVAYCKYVWASWESGAKAFLKANPDFAESYHPPLDEKARAAFEESAAKAREIEKRYNPTMDLSDAGQSLPPEDRAAFLHESVVVLEKLGSASPAQGHALLRATPESGIDMPSDYGAPFRVGVLRAHCLALEGDTKGSINVLRELADFAIGTDWSPTLLGALLRVVAAGIVYETGVLALAEQDQVPADDLQFLSDPARMTPLNAVACANAEFRMGLRLMASQQALAEGITEIDMAKYKVSEDFATYGATSLGHWAKREADFDENGWRTEWAERLRSWVTSPPDLANSKIAKELLGVADANPALRDQVEIVAQAEISPAEVNAYLLSTRIHALRKRHPNDWRTRAEAAVSEYKYVRLHQNGNELEVRHADHPFVTALGESDRVLATVRIE